MKKTRDDEFIQHLIQKGLNEFYLLPPLHQKDFEQLNTQGYAYGSILPQEHIWTDDPTRLLKHNGAIVGAAGVGKTCLTTLLASSLSNVGVYIFNIRPEINDYLPGFINVDFTETIPNIYDNKPWMNAIIQAFQLASIITDPYLLQYSKTALGIVLSKFYERNESPSPAQIEDEIGKLTTKNSRLTIQQLQKLKSVIELNNKLIGEAANRTSGFRIEEHQEKKIVFNMNLGDNALHAMFITYFLWSIYSHNIAKNLRTKLRTVFFVDESRYFINEARERLTDFGAPVIDGIFSKQRDAGLSVIAATQTGHTKAFSTNAGLKILFNVGDARYFKQASAAIGLTTKEEDWLKRNLTTGQAVVRTYYFPKPFIVQFNLPRIEKETDEARQKRRERFLSKIKTQIEDNVVDVRPSKPASPSPGTAEQAILPGLVQGSLELLKLAAKKPMTPVSEAYKKLELTSHQGNKAQQHLTENELVTAEPVNLSKGRGRPAVLLEPTPKGLELLKNFYPGLEPRVLPGRGSLSHRVAQQLVARYYRRKGFLVRIEHREADVGVQTAEGETWAVEIVTEATRNARERVQKNRETGATKTIIVAPQKLVKRFEKQLRSVELVEVESLNKYLLKRGEKSQDVLR